MGKEKKCENCRKKATHYTVIYQRKSWCKSCGESYCNSSDGCKIKKYEEIKNLKLNKGDIFYNAEVNSYYVVTKVFKTKNKFYTYEIAMLFTLFRIGINMPA